MHLRDCSNYPKEERFIQLKKANFVSAVLKQRYVKINGMMEVVEMTEEMLVKLEAAGNRTQELLKRFANNEAICVRLVKKFPGDENYKHYLDEIRVQDFAKAEGSVHTLKGVASNLGLTKVSDLTQKIVDEIRGEKDMDKINGWTEELKVVYEETVEIINAYM